MNSCPLNSPKTHLQSSRLCEAQRPHTRPLGQSASPAPERSESPETPPEPRLRVEQVSRSQKGMPPRVHCWPVEGEDGGLCSPWNGKVGVYKHPPFLISLPPLSLSSSLPPFTVSGSSQDPKVYKVIIITGHSWVCEVEKISITIKAQKKRRGNRAK